MAVPKTKVSKQRRNKRYAGNSPLTAPALVECPQCHEMKKSHAVCPHCGYYNGVKVVEKKEKKAE